MRNWAFVWLCPGRQAWGKGAAEKRLSTYDFEQNEEVVFAKSRPASASGKQPQS